MFKDWNKFEKYWFFAFAMTILVVTLIFSSTGTNWDDPWSIFLNWVLSPTSALTGILCVVLVARGHISNYYWGLYNVLSYGILAYCSGYYGDMILNFFWFLPMQFIGYWAWRKRPTFKKGYVKIRRMTAKQAIYSFVGGIIATVLFGLVLFNVDHWFTEVMKRNVSIYTYFDQTFGIPYLGAFFDSSTEVLQIFGQILQTLAFAEQWIFWILTNIITIVMWGVVIKADPTTIAWAAPTLVMWIAYLVNSVYGWINWRKEAKKNENI